MTKDEFIVKLTKAASHFPTVLATPQGSWKIKGFIDVDRLVYSLSTDTKVISKLIEVMLIPQLERFALNAGLTIEFTKEQNYYPDLTFIDQSGNLFALDLKSSYRKSADRINGMTLGAFTGYFRNRQSTKNITHPYGQYSTHVVLGVIYTPLEIEEEYRVCPLEALSGIESVAKDFTVFVQEKWRIAADHPGSGNTKNIGSVTNINELIEGRGVFAALGENFFDEYWKNYLTNDMAKAAELSAPYYTSIAEYKKFRNIH